VLCTAWTEKEGLNLSVRRVQDDTHCLLTPHGSQEGIIKPDLPISGVSAGESLTSKRDLADAVLPVSDVLSLPK
jgi:hypothetical protein